MWGYITVEGALIKGSGNLMAPELGMGGGGEGVELGGKRCWLLSGDSDFKVSLSSKRSCRDT